MTIQQMHNRINLKIQKVNSSAFDNILPEEIDEYINSSIMQFVKDKFEPRSNQFRLGFEQSIKRIEDLRTLIKTDELDCSDADSKYNFLDDILVDKATIPQELMLPLSVSLSVFYNKEDINYTVTASKKEPNGQLGTDYNSKRIGAKFVQHDDIPAILADPFNKPRITKGLFSVDNDVIFSYTTKEFITDKIILTYIKKPATVSLSGGTGCDLSENVHDEIVTMTAEEILSDIRALGTNKQIQELNDIE